MKTYKIYDRIDKVTLKRVYKNWQTANNAENRMNYEYGSYRYTKVVVNN